MNAKGEEYILQTSINDNESRRVFPIPRKNINKRFKEKLQLEQYTIEQKEISIDIVTIVVMPNLIWISGAVLILTTKARERLLYR